MKASMRRNGFIKKGPEYLYNKGDECTSITGGWDPTSYYKTDGLKVKHPTYFEMGDVSTNGYAGGAFTTHNKIDLTDVVTLTVDFEIISVSPANGGELCLYAHDAYFDNHWGTVKPFAVFTPTGFTKGTLTLDVLNAKGGYYITVYVAAPAHANYLCTGRCYSVRAL